MPDASKSTTCNNADKGRLPSAHRQMPGASWQQRMADVASLIRLPNTWAVHIRYVPGGLNKRFKQMHATAIMKAMDIATPMKHKKSENASNNRL